MTVITNGKIFKNNKRTGIKTIVKGIRAEKSFFDKCSLVAKQEGVTRNELIVKVLTEYCDNNTNKRKETVYENDKILIGK